MGACQSGPPKSEAALVTRARGCAARRGAAQPSWREERDDWASGLEELSWLLGFRGLGSRGLGFRATGLVSVKFGVFVCGLEILDCPEELDELEGASKTADPEP